MEQETPPGAVTPAEVIPPTSEQVAKSKLDIRAVVRKVLGFLKPNPAAVETTFSRTSQEQLNKEFGAAPQPTTTETPPSVTVTSPTAALGPEHSVGQDPVGTKITHVNLGGTSASELGPEHDVINTPSKN